MRAITLTVILMFITACAGSSSPPQTQYYLLPVEGPVGVTRLDAPVKVGISRLKISDYLSQKGIVVETQDGTIRPAHFHEWAEPLSEGMRSFLRAQLSKALGYGISSDTSRRAHWEIIVDIDIERLHGTLRGDAILLAHWRLTRGTAPENFVAYRFSQTRPLQREGYPGLVEAETALLSELSGAIADSIREFQP